MIKKARRIVASKLLISMNLPYSGTTKDRKYYLDGLIKN